jgi:hypothetical protein
MMPETLELDDEPAIPLDEEPEIPLTDEPATETRQPPAPPAEPPAVSLMEILPPDFPLPGLIRFVPNVALRAALDEAARYALAVDIKGGDGLKRADVALTAVRASQKAVEEHFADPREIANRLHKGITSTLAEWLEPGRQALATVGERIKGEHRRLQAIEAEARRKAQEEENRKAREEFAARAREAEQSKAPAAVVQQLQREAETAVAPPVQAPPTAAAPVLKGSTVVENWTATIAGTPRDADQAPDIEALSDAQKVEVLKLLKAILDTRAPLACIALNWSYLRKRAKADKSTLAIPGVESYDAGGVRAKATRTK